MTRQLKFLGIAIGIMLWISGTAWSQKYTIKFATIAPDGSTWMNIMKELDQELRKQTNAQVGFKIYGGGVLGDELDVLRKIRIGQLHAAGFTGVGMGEIAPEVRILDAPFLFQNYEQVDHIYQKYGDTFAASFAKNGYEVLGWAEVGFVYIFTKHPVATPADLGKMKMWVWEGDPVAEATFKAFGINPVPLSIIDVMTALQTNMVDGVYTSPLAAVSLQWFTKVGYMVDLPLADASGAILISEKMYQKIPANYQQILKQLCQKYMARLTQLSRKENQEAIEILKKNGIKVTKITDPATLANYDKIGATARRQLVGPYYSQELLEQVESAIKQFRKQ